MLLTLLANRIKSNNNVQSARVAGGGLIGLEPYRVTLDLLAGKHLIKIQDALVSKAGPDNLMLIGIMKQRI